MSNTTFNNALFNCPTISNMHESMERLYFAAKEIKGKEGQTTVSLLLDESPQTLNNWEARGISNRGAIAAQTKIGCSASWLRTGEGEMRPSAPESTQKKAINYEASSPGENRLPIRRALFKLSAGVSGYEVEYEDGESDPIFMGKRWFESNRYKPERLIAIKVSGRSMEPSLHDGDLVIVNTDDTTLKDGEVFAANFEGELVIKRLKRESGNWYLSSDNQDKIRFSDKLCSEGCGLIGRIVYKQSEHI